MARKPFPERGSLWRRPADGKLALVVLPGQATRYVLDPRQSHRAEVAKLATGCAPLLVAESQLPDWLRADCSTLPTRAFVEHFEPYSANLLAPPPGFRLCPACRGSGWNGPPADGEPCSPCDATGLRPAAPPDLLAWRERLSP